MSSQSAFESLGRQAYGPQPYIEDRGFNGPGAPDTVPDRRPVERLNVVPWTIQSSVVEVAERLVGIQGPKLDELINSGLRELGQALHVDWALLSRPRGAAPATSYSWRNHSDGRVPDDLMLLRVRALASAMENGGYAAVRLEDTVDSETRKLLSDIAIGAAAIFSVPLGAAGRGMLAFGSASPNYLWCSAIFTKLRLAAAVFGQALAYQDAHATLERELDEARRMQNAKACHQDTRPDGVAAYERFATTRHAGAADDCRREEMQGRLGSAAIVGQSPAVRGVLQQLEQVAVTASTVLLLGETGTGKELLATHIHELSARRNRLMVRVNCAAIPSTLIESELFGREKGAFTGALWRQIGRFETADKSTIFLDEIGDLPTEVQVKLLRVLEERRIERLGSPTSVPVDVRIVAATHRDLEKRIADEAFREDLFYRLNVFPIRVPALRERAEDIPLLVWHFVVEFSKAFGKRIDAIPRESMAALQGYHWPGNIRELRNVVERAMIVASGPRLTIPLPAVSPALGPVRVKLEEVEREHIRSILERVRWRIRGLGGAADQLGLRPTTLETRMAKLGIARPRSA